MVYLTLIKGSEVWPTFITLEGGGGGVESTKKCDVMLPNTHKGSDMWPTCLTPIANLSQECREVCGVSGKPHTKDDGIFLMQKFCHLSLQLLVYI